MLTGTLVNTGSVLAGSVIGLFLGNLLPERLRDTVMKGLGLCTLFIGITGMLGGSGRGICHRLPCVLRRGYDYCRRAE